MVEISKVSQVVFYGASKGNHSEGLKEQVVGVFLNPNRNVEIYFSWGIGVSTTMLKFMPYIWEHNSSKTITFSK